MRSIRNRLALLFAAIILTAIGAIYVWVVPQLESRLRGEKVSQLRTGVRDFTDRIGATVGSNASAKAVDRIVAETADAVSLRVTLLRVSRVDGRIQIGVIADSNLGPEGSDLAFPSAGRAARTGHVQSGVEAGPLGAVGQAARPFSLDGRPVEVVVFSRPLSDVQSTVSLVRRQVLIAGAAALVFAVLAGYLVAGALARRVKRLEAAAEAVAAGDFDHPPVPVDSKDELGQLARAFNSMQSELAQLDTARKRFIATASHELRTPIFSLGGFVELLEDEDLDGDTRKRFLGQLSQQIARLRKLSVDLLDLSRLEAGSLELRTETVDLTDLARSVADEFEPRLADRDAKLELRLERGPVNASCDPVRVAQILRILLDNALRHTPSGTGIVVSAARSNGATRLAVCDDGGGIEPLSKPRVFDPFFTAGDEPGSGLGLAIAKELADHMRGRLAVDSEPGSTTFTLEIPA